MSATIRQVRPDTAEAQALIVELDSYLESLYPRERLPVPYERISTVIY